MYLITPVPATTRGIKGGPHITTLPVVGASVQQSPSLLLPKYHCTCFDRHMCEKQGKFQYDTATSPYTTNQSRSHCVETLIFNQWTLNYGHTMEEPQRTKQ